MMSTKPLFHRERMIIDRNIFKIMTLPNNFVLIRRFSYHNNVFRLFNLILEI